MKERFNAAEDTWLDNVPASGTHTCVRLTKLLPLPCPVYIPPGIIGAATLGAEGFGTLCKHYFGNCGLTWSWWEDPIIQEWLEAVAAAPSAFAVPWFARTWIEEAVRSVSPSPGFHSPIDAALWAAVERNVAFRLHLDYILFSLPPQKRANFLRYLTRAHAGLCTSDSPMGVVPVGLTGEIFYLRPPSTKNWNLPPLLLSAWKTDQSVSADMHKYLQVFVPPDAKSEWIPVPLETREEAAERAADEEDGDYENTPLAAARMVSAANRQQILNLSDGSPIERTSARIEVSCSFNLVSCPQSFGHVPSPRQRLGVR